MSDTPALILVYGADANDRRIVFMREGETYLNYRLRLVDQADIGQTIGALLEQDDNPAATVAQDAPSLLLFSGMPEQTMHQLLGALRDNQHRFDLKAVVTETNRSWTLSALLAELREEHALMRAWHQLAEITQKADLLLMEPNVLLDQGGFEQAVEAVKRFLRRETDEPVTLDNLSEKTRLLSDHLTRLGY